MAAAKLSGEDIGRIFGPAPGTYGVSLGRSISDDTDLSENDLATAYLAESSFAFGRSEQATDLFKGRVARADAFVHVQDLPGQDVLEFERIF